MIRYARILMLTVWIAHRAVAQLSPGDLSRSHRDLEGLENCTQCHTIGKAVSNGNCLRCHTEIDGRMKAAKGFHATVRDQQCAECHSEHHGRDFEIVHFDKRTFDHRRTGYALEGKHAAVECQQCHQTSKIVSTEIQAFSVERRTKTYLGLSRECRPCHQDEHRGQFSASCLTCHSFDGWKPAVKFSHDRARFTLAGAHRSVDCGACHRRTWDNGRAVQFTEMEFASCRSCHEDPHKGRFRQECSQCHTVQSWKTVKTALFDHSVTRFPLKGKHAALKCEQCHAQDARAVNASGERGFHITRYGRCGDCHHDAHAGQFAGRKDGGACESCHTEQGFVPALFTVEQHAQTRFALTGGHAAVPCGACHAAGKVKAASTRIFSWKDALECTTCHEDVHHGQFAGRMSNGCETCHTTAAWDRLVFSHERTRFPLRGAHATLECAQCHKRHDEGVQYVDVPTECATCHKDEHAGQFAVNKTTQCERCHTPTRWENVTFDHRTQSKFPLTGAHETVACGECHRQGRVNSQRTVIYKPLGTACKDCHTAQ